MEVIQPASAGDRRYPTNRVNFHLRLTTIRHSAARFRGLKDTRGYQPGVPLRSTPGFMISPAPQARFISANFRNRTLAIIASEARLKAKFLPQSGYALQPGLAAEATLGKRIVHEEMTQPLCG